MGLPLILINVAAAALPAALTIGNTLLANQGRSEAFQFLKFFWGEGKSATMGVWGEAMRLTGGFWNQGARLLGWVADEGTVTQRVKQGLLDNFGAIYKTTGAMFFLALARSMHNAGVQYVRDRMEDEGDEDEEDFITKAILNTYKDKKYFSSDNTDFNSFWQDIKSTLPFQEGDGQLLRGAFTTLMGFVIQTKSILVGSRENGKDIDLFSSWVKILGFWELLARMIHIYGWSPVALASYLVGSILAVGRAPPGFEWANSLTSSSAVLPTGLYANMTDANAVSLVRRRK